MKITVRRLRGNHQATLSEVYVDGVLKCYGLEDAYHPTTQQAGRRIPAGVYRITARTEGGMHSRYVLKYPQFHKGMLWVRDVPGFEYIYLHVGNDAHDTTGCLLIGRSAQLQVGRYKILQSICAYTELYRSLIDAAVAGSLSIAYIDPPAEFDVIAEMV